MENYNPDNEKYIPQNIGFAAIMADVYRDGGHVRDF